MKLILRDVIPIITLLIILLVLFRIIYNRKYKKHYQLTDIIYLMFIIYIVILLYIVTYDGLLTYNPEMNFKPFKEIFRYKIGSYLFMQNILGNIWLFIPYGMFIKYEFQLKIRYILIVTILFSISIEFVQLLIGRVFDIDDIILNVIGSLIGSSLIINQK